MIRYSFNCKPEHFEKTKELIRRYKSLRHVYEPTFYISDYRIVIEGDSEDMNKFQELREKMVEWNWTHKEGCMWLTPLATTYYHSATWGCTCGLNNFLIENDLE